MVDERDGNDGRSEVTAGLHGDIAGRRVALTNETEETSDRATLVAFDLSDVSTGANRLSHYVYYEGTKRVWYSRGIFGTD